VSVYEAGVAGGVVQFFREKLPPLAKVSLRRVLGSFRSSIYFHSLLASIAGRGTTKAINYFVVGIVILRRTGLAMEEALKKSIFSYGFGFVPTHVFACRVDAAFESYVASAMASWVVSFTM
jgi:hypothetical protein